MLKPALWCIVAISLLSPQVFHGQGNPPGLEGKWRGTLNTGVAELRLLLSIDRTAGQYSGSLNSLDQDAIIPADVVRVDGDSVHLEFKSIKGVYEGKFDAGHSSLSGTWTQGMSFPLAFTRDKEVTAAAAKPEQPIKIEIPIAPTAFRGNGKMHLVYELHITNSSAEEVELKQIDIIAGAPIASIAGGNLNHALARTSFPGGAGGIAYIWVTLEESTAIPAKIRHKLTFSNRTFEGAEVAVATKPLPVLGAPMRGEGWVAVNGPANESVHRRASARVGGKAWSAQRFAIDWVQIGADSKTNTGDGKDNRTYHCYGAEVLAAADAVVTITKDGIPQNVPGDSRAVPITIETVGGNHVILDLGNGRYAFYAHLQPGSLRVRVGDRVKRGQVLGLLGNSGNSSEPHLHFHVCDRNSALECEGVPYVLESYAMRGKDKKYEKREKQLPLADEIVRFE